jgi:hypothetical protein
MFRRLREIGPVALIPLAWGFVTAAHLGSVTDRTLLIAHVVMSVLLAGFAVTGRADMREGVLLAWWRVIATGFFAAASGVAGFVLGVDALLAVALYGWMLLPVGGLVYTARQMDEPGLVYYGGGALCVTGAVVYALGSGGTTAVVSGLAAVAVGQTAPIVDAAFRR